MRILLADDEQDLVLALAQILKRARYSVDTVDNGSDALDSALSQDYDCLVLDVMMPGMNGLDVVRNLRRQQVGTPVLLLTAKAQVQDRVAGLDTGADDYLVKPFAMEEFTARVRALTRRGAELAPKILRAGSVTLDSSTFELACGNTSVRLANREYQMMELLLRRQGSFVSTEQFMNRIWGYESEAQLGVVWAYICYLRRKLTALGADVQIIASRGRGYMLAAREGA